MKRLHKKITALCLSLSLCAAVLAGAAHQSRYLRKRRRKCPRKHRRQRETQEAAQTETTQEILAQVEETAGKMPEGEIYIEPVEGISDDFIRGMDASSVLVEENSGVKYYNFDGEEQDVFQTLAEGGVREISEKYEKDISIAIHYTRITDKAQVDSLVANLEKSEMDYDMIGLSFYPFWDGSMSNMQRVVELIQERYGKKVFIAETSYCYTSEDGDGSGNSLVGIDDLAEGYPATVQGQASMGARCLCGST